MSARTIADEGLPFLETARVVRTGVAVVAVFFLGFVAWAAFAPLESAMIASGVVVNDSAPGAGGVTIAMRVAPDNAEDVRPRMIVKVDLSAHKLRRLPMLTGVVDSVSPRPLQDPRTGQTYFLARIRVDRASLAGFPAHLFPGMPVGLEIPTGAHTALEYLIEPITDVMHNGMREK